MNPHIPETFDEFKLYDQAMVSKFTFTIEDKLVPTTIATAQRAHGSARARLRALRRNARIPLPAATIVRKGHSNDPKRGFGKTRMRVNFLDESKTLAMYGVPPQPIDVKYEFAAMLATPVQMNELVKQYWTLFIQDKSGVLVAIPEWSPDGMFLPIVTSKDIADNTNIDPASGDRVFEMSTTLTLEAYQFRPLEVVKILGKVSVTFEESME